MRIYMNGKHCDYYKGGLSIQILLSIIPELKIMEMLLSYYFSRDGNEW
jgi:hypothetical protein